MNHEAAHAKLDEFKSLKKNWDSYGALPIDPAIIRAAHEFLDNMPADIDFSHIGPCCDGTVGLEWDTGDRLLELELLTPATIGFIWCDDMAEDASEGLYPLANFARSVQRIRWVLGGGTEESR